MPTYTFQVAVTCDTQEQAQQVIIERIEPDEDYGFPYSIDLVGPDSGDVNTNITPEG